MNALQIIELLEKEKSLALKMRKYFEQQELSEQRLKYKGQEILLERLIAEIKYEYNKANKTNI